MEHGSLSTLSGTMGHARRRAGESGVHLRVKEEDEQERMCANEDERVALSAAEMSSARPRPGTIKRR